MSGCKVRLLLAFTNCLDENINQLSDVRTPFLIIHGSEDRLCNPVGSELLFRFICCYTLAQCGSGMFIPDPGSWLLPFPDPGSRIPVPGSKNSYKREGWKKFGVIHLFVNTNFTKCKIIELFTQKYEFGIPGSKRYRIPDPDPQHWFFSRVKLCKDWKR